MASSPAIVGDDLVVHGMDGIVRVLDRSNGRLRWHFRVGSPIESSPIVPGGLDYFGAWNGRVYALDLKRRKLRWSYRTGYKITSSAAIAGETLYIGDYGGRLLALATRTGKLRFVALGQRPRLRDAGGRGGPRLRPLLDRQQPDRLLDVRPLPLARRHRRLRLLLARGLGGPGLLRLLQRAPLLGRRRRAGACSGASRTGGPVSGAAVVVAGVAYAGSTWGRITGVDARSGRVVLRFPHGEYVPVSGNGRPAAPARLLARLGGRAEGA